MAIQSSPYIVFPDEGPVWNMEPGRPTVFKVLGEQTGGSIAIFEEEVPVGGGTPYHLHRTSDEVIHIFSGTFTFKIDGTMSTAGAGTWVYIPRGVPHAWKNSGDAPGRASYIFTPADGARVFEELRLLQVPVPEIEPAVMAEACAQSGYEMLGPPL